MREIILDTETTGFKPSEGHRIVEIGCIEIINGQLTGNEYHQYINPERDMPAGAYGVHGLSEEFLSKFPVFDSVVDEFLTFVDHDPLVIHNATFDMTFLNAEIMMARNIKLKNRAIDTLEIARRKFPGKKNSLDALCKRFSVDNSGREKHGALLDCELLAQVYFQLRIEDKKGFGIDKKANILQFATQNRERRKFTATSEELALHEEMRRKLKS
jgi:DNA polymerase III subunit epsilon